MKIRIDLKILIFLAIFYFTNQVKTYIIIMFFCFIHELGHIIIGILLKMKPSRIEIMPCGFSSSFIGNYKDLNHKIKNGNLLELKNIFTSFAGPIITLLLIIIFIYIDIPEVTKQNIIYSNILILIFNLIPLYPLDGGRILKGILVIKLGKEKSEYITAKISRFTIIILTVISSIAVYYLKNIAVFLICIFLWITTLREKNGKPLDILWQK